MTDQPRRQIAYKVWISDIVNNEFIHQSGEWEPNYVQIREKKVSRVNLIAIVIDKMKSDDGSYVSLIVDDGTENILIKAWKEDTKLLENIEIGSSILIIGRIREYNNNIYITPEIVRILDKAEWAELRKKELVKEYGAPKELVKSSAQQEPPQKMTENSIISEESTVEDVATESDRQKILNTIEKMDGEEGVDTKEVILNIDLEETKVNSMIQELLKEGEIFEIRPGKVKIIE